MNLVFAWLFRVPWVLVLATGFLAMVGALALFSASEGNWFPWAERQLYRAGIGTLLLVFIAVIPVRWIYSWSYIILFGAVLILLALPIIGIGAGATRWIAIGPFNFQPSEPAKIAIILALARYYTSQSPENMQSVIAHILPLICIAVPFGLVIIQPDLGTSAMLLVGSLGVIFVAGIPKRFIAVLAGLAVLMLPVLWSQLYDYQKERIFTFLQPQSDTLGAGYQIAQSKIALGSGGMFGKGFLQGSQSQLNYLPEKQTDFVFTMIGEEFGFVGNVVILLAYFIILMSILLIAVKCKSRFCRLSVIGVSIMLFLYIFVNVAMVTGILPVVGAPLPLISYGGTAMLTVFIGLGMVINAAVNSHVSDNELLK